MNKRKVLYILNNAPNYRERFLRLLAKEVDLTVLCFSGKSQNLIMPESRIGYKYIELNDQKFINLNINEFVKGNSNKYDVILIGYNLRHPFRMLNLLSRKRVIAVGLIYGKNDNYFILLLRRFFLNRSEGVLVYSNYVKERLEKEIKKPIIAFNNTSFSRNDMKFYIKEEPKSKLNLVWVGRYQKRKKIERLIDLADRNDKVNIRIIGPGIKDKLNDSNLPSNVQLYDGLFEDELKEHFLWSHAVFNPGGAGLLVMNAARYGRPIFIDNNSHHGPEIQLAKDSDQYFLDFSDNALIDDIILKCIDGKINLNKLGQRVYDTMYKKYTIEYMTKRYIDAIDGKWNKV